MSPRPEPSVTRAEPLREAIEADALSIARQIARLQQIRARREAHNKEALCPETARSTEPAA